MLRRASLGVAILAIGCGSKLPTESLIAEVDPFIGSGGIGYGAGSIAPTPGRPFGLAKPGPDTSSFGGAAPAFAHCAGYWWEDNEIRAFSQLHLSGTGLPDYGVLGLMPVSTLPPGPISEGSFRAGFDHRKEKATVGRYSVTLDPSGIEVAIAATPRTALYRITYPAEAKLVLSLGHGLGGGHSTEGALTADLEKGEVSGWLHHLGELSDRYGGYRVFFVLRADRPIAEVESFRAALRTPGARTATRGDAGMVLGFGGGGGTIGVQIGLSFIDEATARANLDSEPTGFDLDRTAAETEAAWGSIFDRMQVQGGSSADRRIFAAAIRNAFQMPTLFTEGGRYRGLDGEVHAADGFTYYSDFSLWDTFRTLHPLITLIAPEIERDFVRSLERMAIEDGHLPRWPLATGETRTMIGAHGESMIADSFVKGVIDFDAGAVFDRLWASSQGPTDGPKDRRAGRECIESYIARGYCTTDEGSGSASRTLENAYNDWLLAQLARGLGKTTEADQLEARAKNWRNVWDATSGFLRGRAIDGSFAAPFDPALFSDDFTEGNARQWLFYVPHDVEGLAATAGGADALVQRIDQIFEQTTTSEKGALPDLWYWHGNEPDIHAAYLFAELGRPELTRKWARWISENRYSALPAGLDGNDDGGTLSAWYLFTALGFYPKVGTDRYILGAPRFPKATLHFAGGRVLTVIAEGLEEGRTEVERVTLDGSPIAGAYVTHAELTKGGELRFILR